MGFLDALVAVVPVLSVRTVAPVLAVAVVTTLFPSSPKSESIPPHTKDEGKFWGVGGTVSIRISRFALRVVGSDRLIRFIRRIG